MPADATASTPLPTGTPAAASDLRTFLIADVRGYTHFTQERGDAAAAHLAGRFVRAVYAVSGAAAGTRPDLDQPGCSGSVRGARRSADAVVPFLPKAVAGAADPRIEATVAQAELTHLRVALDAAGCGKLPVKLPVFLPIFPVHRSCCGAS
jgi:class 3 adenylate cyclase